MKNNLRPRTILIVTAMIAMNALAVRSQVAKPVLVALNKAENNLAIIDPVTMKVTAKVPTGDGPHEVVLSADGKTAYAANYGGTAGAGKWKSGGGNREEKEMGRVKGVNQKEAQGGKKGGGKTQYSTEEKPDMR